MQDAFKNISLQKMLDKSGSVCYNKTIPGCAARKILTEGANGMFYYFEIHQVPTTEKWNTFTTETAVCLSDKEKDPV